MKLERLSFSGFNHFTDTFELDLRELSGIVAVVGKNGSGKTTAMDAGPASLYGAGVQNRAFASREGTLHQYATSRDAYIDATWQLDGIGTFRARTNVDPQRRTMEAVLEQILPDGRRVPLNPDGKVVTFKAAVAERFPSLRSILASAYASQNKRGSFGELGQKERMELFAELADLAHLEERAATAKRCTEVADGIAARIRAALDILARDASPDRVAQLGQQLVGIESEIDRLVGERRVGVKRLTSAEADRAARQEEAKQHAVSSQKADAAQATLRRLQGELSGVSLEPVEAAHREELGRVQARLSAALVQVESRRKALVAAYRTATAARGQRIAEQQDLLHDVTKIRDAVALAQQAEARVVDLRKSEQAQRADMDTAREQARVREGKLTQAETAAKELEAVTARAGLLERVKFGEQCGIDPVCPLVTDAVAARGRLPELQGRAALAPGLREGIAHWTAKAAEHERELRDLAKEIAVAERTIRECAVDVKRAPYVEAAEGRIAEYRKDQQAAETAHAAARDLIDTEAGKAEAQRQRDTQVADTRLAQQRTELASRREALEAQVAEARTAVTIAEAEAARTAGAEQALAKTETDLKAAQQAVAEIDRQSARLEAERDGVTQQHADLARKRAEAEETQARLRTVENELLAWQTLAKALGRDGLQRLEIDAAGPVVSDLANTLLTVGWGTRFAVQIVTQVATADKKDTKEKFTVECLDQEHGGEPRDIGDLSGGERVVVERAIRFALLCYVNMRSRTRCRTVWMDESDSGLHIDIIPAYAAMLRKVRELSGADQILLVTHRPELWELCDCVVEVRDGRVAEIRRAA